MNVTIIQSNLIWEGVEANLKHFSEKINSVTEETDLIVLPEMFATGFSMKPKKFAKYDNHQIYWLSEHAKNKNAVITGSIISEENGNFFNSLIWMQADGNYFQYNKRHLFTFAGEDKYYSAGKKSIITNINNWKLKPLICYDLRFPVWSRNKQDYDVLIYIANWPERRNDAWKTLLKARAIENQCYVVGVNRVGEDGSGIYHSGDSAVIDPKGNIISKTKAHHESVETISLDFEELDSFRKKFPVANDADKFDLYI
ncbi:MAG: amidohydrolase [Bacteroidales bacterium]|nr:amidohydrolase [Bacteroidales bacterium]